MAQTPENPQPLGAQGVAKRARSRDGSSSSGSAESRVRGLARARENNTPVAAVDLDEESFADSEHDCHAQSEISSDEVQQQQQPAETEHERIARELQGSEDLARQFMQEEALESYQVLRLIYWSCSQHSVAQSLSIFLVRCAVACPDGTGCDESDASRRRC